MSVLLSILLFLSILHQRTYCQQTFCISSTDLTLCVDSNSGNINSISTKYGLNFTTIGSSWLGDHQLPKILSVNVSFNKDLSFINIIKNITVYTIVSQYNVTLNETISIYDKDNSVIEWVLNVISTSTESIFRTNISTQLQILNSSTNIDDYYFWAPQSSDNNDNIIKNWIDPLQLLNCNQSLSLQFGDGYLNFGGISNANPTMIYPLNIILSKKYKHGISFIYDMDDIIFGSTLDISSTNILYQRYFNKISYKNQNLHFRTFIKLNNGFNIRNTLNWTANTYPDLFYPISYKYNKNIPGIGFGLYTCAMANDINVTNVVTNSGTNINWESAQWPPYFGMYTPPTSFNETWISNNGQNDQMNCGSYKHSSNISYAIIYNELINMYNIGINNLLYFNLFEYGQNVLWPLSNNTNNPNKNTWKNASEFLWFYLNDSISYNSEYKSVNEWQHGILLDPNPSLKWGKWLINQTINRLQILSDSFKGISIDRLDHTREYNYNQSDDYSLCFDSKNQKYIECESLLTSWKAIAPIITSSIHNGTFGNGEYIITSNYDGATRVDLNLISDVIFSEGYNVNGIGLSGLMRPTILWTYNANEIINTLPSPHTYFQRSLYMKVNLMSPCIGNDHSILPNDFVQLYYNMYGELFKALRSTIWWLNIDTVEIIYDENDPKYTPLFNSFHNKQKNQLVFVLVFGDMNINQIININVIGINTSLNQCSYINPQNSQSDGWQTLPVYNNTIVNNIILGYGCAVVRCLVH